MAHILGVTLILGAIICAVTGFNNNIPALAGGGMLLVEKMMGSGCTIFVLEVDT